MPEESFQEKTEKATPRRRQKAREKGRVAKSSELNSALILLAGLAALGLLVPGMSRKLMDIFRFFLSQGYSIQLNPANLCFYFIFILKGILLLLAPFLLVVTIAGVTSNLAQVGFLFTAEPLKPKLSALDPLSGFKRLLSIKGLFELPKAILKLAIIGIISYLTVRGKATQFFLLSQTGLNGTLMFIGKTALLLGLRVSLALLILAAIDCAFQKWDYEKKLRMTKEEVKEERKQYEGDPLVKARIRSVQRELARRRMMKEVPKADVIISNPTTLAVALRYDPEKMSAPQVVAKGARLLAQKILELAKKHNVPIVEDRKLARIIYRSVKIGEEIPVALYQAVAEVLSYIYRLKNKVLG